MSNPVEKACLVQTQVVKYIVALCPYCQEFNFYPCETDKPNPSATCIHFERIEVIGKYDNTVQVRFNRRLKDK